MAPGRLHPKAGHPKPGITALCLAVLVASTHTIEGCIVGVSDGDTITLLDADTFKRLQAIEFRQQLLGAALSEMARVLSAPQAAAVAAAMQAHMQVLMQEADGLPVDVDEQLSGELVRLLEALGQRPTF